MTDGAEWGELFVGLLQESGGCFFLLLLGLAILILGRWRGRKNLSAKTE